MTMRRTKAASGTYSDVVAVEGDVRWIHVAGQLGIDLGGGTAAPPGFAEQAAIAFDRLEAALALEGARLEHLVRTTVYVTSFDEWPAFAAIRAERLGASLPASTALQVAGLLGGALVEIDAIAAVPAGG